jgi:hypothetical protein
MHSMPVQPFLFALVLSLSPHATCRHRHGREARRNGRQIPDRASSVAGLVGLFVLLSLADLTLTCWLLADSGGQVYEANPVAGWWLARHGLAGLACWKGATVLLVLALVAFIARRRPRTAGRVLAVGCSCLLFVVVYSAALCRAGERRVLEEASRQLKQLEAVNRQVRATQRRMAAFLTLRAEVQQELLAGRCTLRAAADRLTRSARECNPGYLKGLVASGEDRPAEECIAANLIRNAVSSQEGPLQAAEVARRFEHVFRLTYGRSPPATLVTPVKFLPTRWTVGGETSKQRASAKGPSLRPVLLPDPGH